MSVTTTPASARTALSNSGTLADIRVMPTVVTAGMFGGAAGVHESVLRYYHIVQKIKALLIAGTPPLVLLEIIADLEGAPQ